MSVINKMLQDLDARAAAPRSAGTAAVAAVPAKPPRSRRTLLVVLAAVLVAMALAALWIVMARQRPALPVPAPVLAVPKPPPVKTIVLAPAPAVAPPPPPSPSPAPARIAPPVVAIAQVKPAAPAPRDLAPSQSAPARAETPNAAVRIDNPYRRALEHLHEGRKEAAIGALEQALQLDPRNSAARETLVGLLVEEKRPLDAIAQLRTALNLEPRQPALAMLLARLQIGQGSIDTGIDTLLRTLPFADAGDAADSAAYHAFLAGALQRSNRHREAVAQYQAALQMAPDNGVWWMGLGLSLRADGRTADAAEAFRRARAGAGLSPELDAFVERQQQGLR